MRLYHLILFRGNSKTVPLPVELARFGVLAYLNPALLKPALIFLTTLVLRARLASNTEAALYQSDLFFFIKRSIKILLNLCLSGIAFVGVVSRYILDDHLGDIYFFD